MYVCSRAIISIQMYQCLYVYISGSYIPHQALRDLLMCALDQFQSGSSMNCLGRLWG